MDSASVYLAPAAVYWAGALRTDVAIGIDASGRLVGISQREALPPTAEVLSLPGRLILPGLVNAHSHAFQRLLRGRVQYAASGRDDFWSWRERMYRCAEALDEEGLYVASRQAFLEMALAGITAVGEFHYVHHRPDGRPYDEPNALADAVVRAAREVGIRICLLKVAYARAGHDVAPNPPQRRFLYDTPGRFLADVAQLGERWRADPGVTVGVAPHSVRAVPREWLEALSEHEGPLHVHVSEQPAEIEACVAEHGLRPVELLHATGLLAPRTTAVHAVHLSLDEVRLLGEASVTVCACPSTERDLGDGVVPADALLEAGAHLALGSDSQAQIDLLDEARQLEGHLRLVRLRRAVLDPGGGTLDGLSRRLLAFATEGGARALGGAEATGSLEAPVASGGAPPKAPAEQASSKAPVERASSQAPGERAPSKALSERAPSEAASRPTGRLEPGAQADLFTVDLRHPALAGCQEDALIAAALSAPSAAISEVMVGGRFLVRDGVHPLTDTIREAFGALAARVR